MSLIGEHIAERLKALGDRKTAVHSQRFFKTARGEYGEGDVFLGIRIPVIRKTAAEYKHLKLADLVWLLQSRYHEIRLFALIAMVHLYRQADSGLREQIYNAYLKNTRYINNWDLVDSSADKIVGCHLLSRSREILYELAASTLIWERRIAVISTFHFIRKRQFNDIILLAAILLDDREDLIHKAVGWMLREAGKREESVLHTFLNEHCTSMPRTMLRYSIEKLPKAVRCEYLARK